MKKIISAAIAAALLISGCSANESLIQKNNTDVAEAHASNIKEAASLRGKESYIVQKKDEHPYPKSCNYRTVKDIKLLYHSLHISTQLKYNTFKKAIDAYNKTLCKRENIIGIVDYSKSSKEKRFFVIDLKKKKILLKTYVAHAKASGWEFAKHYSNDENSSKSTYGILKTGNLYYGKNGLSLRIRGLEKNINDNTFKRHIVIHGAKYVGNEWMKIHSNIQGRSLGCFAIPTYEYKNILPKISDGTIFYVNPMYRER
ncbi:murein L,D-transpeptidase catalytic domain-containing protein [Photobacterium kishitanii]|uniref:Peptidase n=1 Tax=Photobacterium kishitanii TaxID=318456 RepID=A0A2T3KMC0_9GAMM|nr:murein L,D-transpeptidase catalytic domain family protein [Photobacterium kishitanii]PSV00895.1 peptidase [Photobacterium kishitanii]